MLTMLDRQGRGLVCLQDIRSKLLTPRPDLL